MSDRNADQLPMSVVGPKMDAWERQQIFREMVVQQLSNGPLNRNRRRRLVQYAAGLGINATQAGNLIQQAYRKAEAVKPITSPWLRISGSESNGTTWQMLIITLALIGLVQLAITATS